MADTVPNFAHSEPAATCCKRPIITVNDKAKTAVCTSCGAQQSHTADKGWQPIVSKPAK